MRGMKTEQTRRQDPAHTAVTCSSVAHCRAAATSARYTALVPPSQPSNMSFAMRMRTSSVRAALLPAIVPGAHDNALLLLLCLRAGTAQLLPV